MALHVLLHLIFTVLFQGKYTRYLDFTNQEGGMERLSSFLNLTQGVRSSQNLNPGILIPQCLYLVARCATSQAKEMEGTDLGCRKKRRHKRLCYLYKDKRRDWGSIFRVGMHKNSQNHMFQMTRSLGLFIFDHLTFLSMNHLMKKLQGFLLNILFICHQEISDIL